MIDEDKRTYLFAGELTMALAMFCSMKKRRESGKERAKAPSVDLQSRARKFTNSQLNESMSTSKGFTD